MKIKQSKKSILTKLFWSVFVAISLLSSSYLFVQNNKFSHNGFVTINTERVSTESIEVTDDPQTRDFNIYNNVIGFIRQLLY